MNDIPQVSACMSGDARYVATKMTKIRTNAGTVDYYVLPFV